MPVVIGSKAEHGFDEPLGLLTDCHRRIERFLGVLLTLAREANGGLLAPDRRAALVNALEYFATAAPKHTADEEESLFPRMRAACDSGALDDIEHLEADHAEAHKLHDAIAELGARWLKASKLSAADAASLRQATEKVDSLYRAHIEFEESIVFPQAARALTPGDLVSIGREMAARRNS